MNSSNTQITSSDDPLKIINDYKNASDKIINQMIQVLEDTYKKIDQKDYIKIKKN